MAVSAADDGTDFRPFFDMVIGILFVLLILVAAQTYFQQEQDDTPATEAAKREAALRRADIASFISTVADRLRADGIEAEADADAGSVVLPLDAVLAVDAAGRPKIEDATTDLLAAAVAKPAVCVTQPRSIDPTCAPFARLDLDSLAIETQVVTLAPGTALARNRFADFCSALLSARIIGAEPDLIGASNLSGGRVLDFRSGPAGKANAASSGALPPRSGLGGNIVLDFTFR